MSNFQDHIALIINKCVFEKDKTILEQQRAIKILHELVKRFATNSFQRRITGKIFLSRLIFDLFGKELPKLPPANEPREIYVAEHVKQWCQNPKFVRGETIYNARYEYYRNLTNEQRYEYQLKSNKAVLEYKPEVDEFREKCEKMGYTYRKILDHIYACQEFDIELFFEE